MRDVVEQLEDWLGKGEEVALATVVDTWGSSPRAVGAKMGLTLSGGLVGSVSGGCVEGAVVEAGQRILRGEGPQLLHFGVADETAWGVGLACGGEIDVYVSRLEGEQFEFIQGAFEQHVPVATLTVVQGPETVLGRQMSGRGNEAEELWGSIGAGLDGAALSQLRRGIRINRSFRIDLESEELSEPVVAFVDVLPPSPKLIMIGGAHITVALASIARRLGHETVVIDPRKAFSTQERFPDVDSLLQIWPQQAMAELDLNTSTAVVVLTHDPKIDDPALMAALSSPAYYIGALGSRRTHEKRIRRLLEAGASEEELARVHAPIGLEIGAKSPEEIAVAIMAEVIEAFRRAS